MDILQDIPDTGLYIDESIETHFKESSGWAKFIAIAGMAISGIAVVMSFTLGGRIEAALNGGFIRSGTAGFLWVIAILLFAISFFVLSIFLYRFANRMQVAINTSDKYEFAESMRNLRNTYKIMAILFSVYFLLFVGGSISDLIK